MGNIGWVPNGFDFAYCCTLPYLVKASNTLRWKLSGEWVLPWAWAHSACSAYILYVDAQYISTHHTSHLYYRVAMAQEACSECRVYLVVYPGLYLYLVSTGYQPYRQAIAGFLRLTFRLLYPQWQLPQRYLPRAGTPRLPLLLQVQRYRRRWQSTQVQLRQKVTWATWKRTLTHAELTHAETCQVSWTPTSKSASWTPSTSTTLISVPPTWQWYTKASIQPWQVNWWLRSSKLCRLTEANALHSEVMERQRETLVSEARDRLASIEQRAADEISKKNLLLNEQAAHAMSEQKSAHLHVQAQDHRIKELSAELSQIVNTAGLMSASVDKSNADLRTARSELAEYRTQLDAMNQHAMDMKRAADSQKQNFEVEIEKLRKEQKEVIRSLKSQPLEGTPGLEIHYGPGQPQQSTSQPSRPIIVELDSSGKKPAPSSDADDDNSAAGPSKPPGLPGGGPPDDDASPSCIVVSLHGGCWCTVYIYVSHFSPILPCGNGSRNMLWVQGVFSGLSRLIPRFYIIYIYIRIIEKTFKTYLREYHQQQWASELFGHSSKKQNFIMDFHRGRVQNRCAMGRSIQGDTDPFVVWLQDNAGVIVNDKGEMKGSAIQASFPRWRSCWFLRNQGGK